MRLNDLGIYRKAITGYTKQNNKGNYAWNLGIFIMHPSTWIDLMQKITNDNYGYLLKAWNERQENRNNITINESDYAKLEAASIDYAIMEEIKNTNINVKVSIFNSRMVRP